MPGFRPIRSSPPLKSFNLASSVGDTTLSTNVSRPSIPELVGMTSEEVELLDAVIQRASPSATTFLTVFKAYNDVLQERGLDAHEVVIYGKLLKLGTLRGKNWGEKWEMVKLQQGYGERHVPNADVCTRSVVASPLANGLRNVVHPDDAFTLHSHENESEKTESEINTNIGSDEFPDNLTTAFFSRVPESRPRLNSEINSLRPGPPRLHLHNYHAFNSNTSDVTEYDAAAPSTTPPSYRAVQHDNLVTRQTKSHYISSASYEAADRLPSTPNIASAAVARQVVAQARERRGSVVNEEDAWKKIKVLQDEKDADKFRDDRLVERCWDAWTQGFQWILMTNDQIDEARDILVMRLCLQRWQNLTASRTELQRRIIKLVTNRCLRAALALWKARLKNKRQADWRNNMRTKMKTIRLRREGKLKKDAWAKWRQSYRSHLSSQHFSNRLILRCYENWKKYISRLNYLDTAADNFLRIIRGRTVDHLWYRWKRTVEIRNTETALLERVDHRIMGEVMDAWRSQTHDNIKASEFHDFLLLKCTIRSWKTARDRIRVLEARSVKHLARQDDILVRAVFRVWKARERGKLLERVKAVRLAKTVWMLWKHRMQNYKEFDGLVQAFSMHRDSFTASSAFQIWRQNHVTHQNSLSFAFQYYSTQLCYRMILAWRMQLREKFRRLKQARMVEKFFFTRRAWRTWTLQVDNKNRERRLQLLQKQKRQKYFHIWLSRAQRERQCKLAEQTIQHNVSFRILRVALAFWTNRVIEIKLRELEIAQKNANMVLIAAFKKWKQGCVRHVEELSLMESYQFVKREENIRRMFHAWLSATRSSRYRRITLQHKEDEMKLTSTSAAWDRWRDRFSNEKLRPIEYNVLIQNQKNLLFRAFGIWHSKTKTLPAIRFHASHTKSKVWEIWRGAMPRALQSKQARDKDKYTVQAKFLDKWVENYRTKMALKAVARARYLRLPTAVPRQVNVTSRPTPLKSLTRGKILPRQLARLPAGYDNAEVGPSSRPFGTRTSVAGFLSTKEPLETTPPPLKAPLRLRDPNSKSPKSLTQLDTERSQARSSPPPSSIGGEGSRTRLWLELRDVQKKTQSPSLHSRTREPP